MALDIPEDPKSLSERLMYLVKSSKSTDISEWTGVPYNTVNSWMNSKQLPSSESLIELFKKRGVSIQWLLTGFGEPYITELPTSSETTPAQQFTNYDHSTTRKRDVSEDGGTKRCETVIHVPAFDIRITHISTSDAQLPDHIDVPIPLIKSKVEFK
jgi:phage repressor protein C with HTH and peptisase S24 domain